MKKFIKIFMVAAMLVATLAVAASAAVTLSYEFVPYNEEAGEYDLVINLAAADDVEKFNTFGTRITFNTDVIAPFSYEAGGVLTAEVVVGSGRNQKIYAFNMADEEWTIDGSSATAYISCYTADFDQFDATSLDIMTVPMYLVDGAKIEDLKASDVVVEWAYLSTNYNPECSKYGFNDPMYDTPFTAVNMPIEGGEEPDQPENPAIENVGAKTENGRPVFEVNFPALESTADAYGFVGTVRNENGVAEGDFTLESANVVSAEIENYNAAESAKARIKNIPEGTTVTVAVRAYYVIEGVTVYGDIMEYDFVG